MRRADRLYSQCNYSISATLFAGQLVPGPGAGRWSGLSARSTLRVRSDDSA